MEKRTGGEKKYAGFYLTVETLKRLRIYAASTFMSLSEIVENAIKEYLKRH